MQEKLPSGFKPDLKIDETAASILSCAQVQE